MSQNQKYQQNGNVTQIQILIYLGLSKMGNMNMNTIIWTDICEYKYKYEYYQTQN